MREFVDTWWKSLSDEKKTLLVNRDEYGNDSLNRFLDSAEILDPTLVNMLDSDKTLKPMDKMLWEYHRPEFSVAKFKTDIWSKYPLISRTAAHKKHNTLYVNTIWEKLYQNA